MAQYRLSAQVIGRSSGRSVTAAAAYRSGERIVDERTGEIHDYTRKEGVLHAEILAPEGTPDWMHDRAQLWNAVEAVERRKDAQLAREIQLSLPHELTHDERLALVRGYVQDQHVSRGMIADIAMHAPSAHEEADHRNYHCHVMLTMRALTNDGFGSKAREWNDKELLEQWREEWAHHQNRALELKGVASRVDHRSLEDQGEFREPQVHLGPIATEIERDGRQSHLGDENRAINKRNGQRADLLKADNLIDARIAFEQRKFDAWAERKRDKVDEESKQRLAQNQLGTAVRMQALAQVLDAEFGSTKENLTFEHDKVASKLAVDGWRKFVRDLTFITRRDENELARLEKEMADIRQAEADRLAEQQAQEAKRQAEIEARNQATKEKLKAGIEAARVRREDAEWQPLPDQKKAPQKPLKPEFDRVNKPEETRQKDDDQQQFVADRSGQDLAVEFKRRLEAKEKDRDDDRER